VWRWVSTATTPAFPCCLAFLDSRLFSQYDFSLSKPMANVAPLHSVSFHLALESFKKSLSPKEKSEFGGTTFNDLQDAVRTIQNRQSSTKKLQSMRRLEGFLEAMKEYDKVIQVFVNTSTMLAFVWGPMKFLLQTACTFAEAFDALMDAYERIGEQFPLLAQYEQLYSHTSLHMGRVLSLLYEDILRFHWKAMKYFKSRMWKQLFHAVWKSFNTDFSDILRNLREHRSLIESQANIIQFSETIRIQEVAKETLKLQQKEELFRQRDVVHQWLSPAKYEADQEQYSKVRRSYPGTGRWLLRANRFNSWFDRDLCSNQLLWLTGIPGAG
jgi:tetratricopeptide (TPR) repeat protein